MRNVDSFLNQSRCYFLIISTCSIYIKTFFIKLLPRSLKFLYSTPAINNNYQVELEHTKTRTFPYILKEVSHIQRKRDRFSPDIGEFQLLKH